MKLASVEEMRRIEQQTDARGHSYAKMMEMAGRAVADAVVQQSMVRPGDRALVLVGPGNNGGDGLVAAHYLLEAGCDVSLYLWKRDVGTDANYRRLTDGGSRCRMVWAEQDERYRGLREELAGCRAVVDAFLGTGAARPIQGQLAGILAVVAAEVARRNAPEQEAHPRPISLRFPLAEAQDSAPRDASVSAGPHRLSVVAIDCPTGLNCDTGALDPAAVPADLTVTFAYPKWGHTQHPGAGACGALAVADIGVPPDLDDSLPVELAGAEAVAAWLPPRPADANKGTFGKVLIAGGSSRYTGAPALSGLAAARSGAGHVTVALPREIQPFLAARLLSLTWLPLPGMDGRHTREGGADLRERLGQYDGVLVGPGLTTDEAASGFLDALVSPPGASAGMTAPQFVFDADALNLLSRKPDWHAELPPLSILTPHPGEMSRLTGRSIAEINGERIAVARASARAWGHIVLLKGAFTVVAHPDGRTSVLPFASAALAKAGSGDVLAGVIVALLAQGLEAYEAAVAGAYLHGMAGVAAGRRTGAASVTAEDLVAAIGESLGALYEMRRANKRPGN